MNETDFHRYCDSLQTDIEHDDTDEETRASESYIELVEAFQRMVRRRR